MTNWLKWTGALRFYPVVHVSRLRPFDPARAVSRPEPVVYRGTPEEYKVEQILAHRQSRRRGRGLEYLVSFKG